ncbi:ArsR/SmtB family transcription factor [Kitasatospora azatica]|uniref:ArsR/SmtB family transcription factor n=1 Tax=Kitasatospora azatica TaxID=58347 RepID=UPI00068D37C0|nr:metalloregulator ArsR/SmtB family transcription factor [Kitasatospora azatica]
MSNAAEAGRAPEDVLVALADQTRREVLAIIVREGGATSTSLAARLPVTRQAVAKHLAVLERAKLVRPRRVGREVQYEVDLQPLKYTRQWMDTLAAAWEHRLSAIKDLAEGNSTP